MNRQAINHAVDEAFASFKKSFDPVINKHLYPDIAKDPDHLWLRIKEAIEANNALLEAAIKAALYSLLADDADQKCSSE